MIFVKTVPLILIILKSTECSLVFDTMSQTGAYINKYCQETEYCLEGTHLMCRQYDQNQKMGPRCKDMFQNDYDKETELISMFNDIRGQIATGRMVTSDGKLFPRGYGMMRLKVDPELTLFAKTMSHACFRRFQEENCANTDVLKSTTLVYAEVKQFAFEKNLTAAMNLLREQITANIPAEWFTGDKSDDNDMRDEKYKVILQGAVRHVGCAMRLMSTDSEPANYYNCVLCYFANVNWPVHQKPYKTEHPSPGKGFTEECGCPIGYKETENCLCDVAEKNILLRASQLTETRSKPLPHLKPARSKAAQKWKNSTYRMCSEEQKIVMMPIFSIQNKKKHKKVPSELKIKPMKVNVSSLFYTDKKYVTRAVTLGTLENDETRRSLNMPYGNKKEKKTETGLITPDKFVESKTKPEKVNVTFQSPNDKKNVTSAVTLGRRETGKKEEKIIKSGLTITQKNAPEQYKNNVVLKKIEKRDEIDDIMSFLRNLEVLYKGKMHSENKINVLVTKSGTLNTTVIEKQKEMQFSKTHTPAYYYDEIVEIDN